MLQSNFQASVESNPRLYWLYFTVIGPENLRHPLNQSEAKLKPTMGWSPTFSRASGSLLVLTLSSNWLRRESTVMLSFVVTDLRDYFDTQSKSH